MNKTDLIDELTVRLGDRRTASAAVEGVVDVITRAVAKGEKVGISGFGVFEKADRAARTARNPTTGEAVRLKKTSVPKFRPGQGFKDIVSGAKKVPPPSKTPGRAVTARVGSASAKAVPAPAKASARSVGSAVKAPGRAVAKATGAMAGSGRSATTAPVRSAALGPGRTVSAKAPAVKAPAATSTAAVAKSPVKAAKAPAKAAKAPARAAKSPARAAAPAKKAARR